jgi:two-component system, LytTR family, sensor kinase
MFRNPPTANAETTPRRSASALSRLSAPKLARPDKLILITVAPYWCYMMVWRIIMYSFLIAATPEATPGPTLGVYFATDLLLFPVLLAFCRVALAIPVSKRQLWWLIPLHLLLGLIFAALREPAFIVAAHWIDKQPPIADWWRELVAEPRMHLYLWAGFAVQYAVIYLTAIGLLAGALLYRRWRSAEQQRLHLEAVTTSARLQALRMQLNPHFLFNALHLVTGLIDADPPNAKRMVVRLGSFLRRVLDEGEREQISLGEELEFVEDYLAIQRARFGERVNCCIDVGNSAREGLVPPLVLQPLIENAVKHGMGAEGAVVRVDLSAKMNKEWLEISVTNAIPATAALDPTGMGIGLKNLRERLAVLYGEFGSIEVATLPGRRYVASLRFPYETTAIA